MDRVVISTDLHTVALGLAIGVGTPTALWVGRSLWQTHKRHRAHVALVEKIMVAFLGTEDDPITGQRGSVGIQQQLEDIHRRVGSNGGSTLFENLDVVKDQLTDLETRLETAAQERAVILQAAEEQRATIAQALAQANISHDPLTPLPYTPLNKGVKA